MRSIIRCISRITKPSRNVSSFAGCLPGLEHVVAQELQNLSPETSLNIIGGGVEFEANVELLMRCGLQLGSASHLMVRLATFNCRALGELERKANALPWCNLLKNDIPYTIKSSSKKSRVYHTGAIHERIHKSISRSFEKELKKPKLMIGPTDSEKIKHAKIVIRLNNDICTISLEATPYPLYRRGYREGLGKAPLREDIAYALCYTSFGLGQQSTLTNKLTSSSSSAAAAASSFISPNLILDPFCGSGTIPIEAAGIKLNLPPGRLQPPPLSHLAMFNETIWNKIYQESLTQTQIINQNISMAPNPSTLDHDHMIQSDVPFLISASDRDAGVIKMAIENAKRANVLEYIDFQCLALKSHPWLQTKQNKNNKNNEENHEENNEKNDKGANNFEEKVEEKVDEKEVVLKLDGKGVILTNPPFGIRVSPLDNTNNNNATNEKTKNNKNKNKSLWPLYQSLGNCLKNNLSKQWTITLLAHDINLARKIGIKNSSGNSKKKGNNGNGLKSILTTKQGGLNVSIMTSNKRILKHKSIYNENEKNEINNKKKIVENISNLQKENIEK